MQAAPPVVVTQPSTPTESSPAATQPEVKPEPTPTTTAPTPPAKAASKRSSPRTVAPTKPAPAPAPEPEAAPPPKVAPPQIAPRLTPAELVEYKTKTEEAIAAAERNLQRSQGRQLSAAQRDLQEKVRGFLAQAQEARQGSDWIRARNLAEKALVLSVELVNSP